MNTLQPESYTEKILKNIIRAADVFKLFDDIGSLSLPEEEPSVLVGFSGGADSTALLHALNTLNNSGDKRFPRLKLYAAHVNHMIRGAEADRDESFCRKFCQKYGIPFFVRRFDVPAAAAESGESLEEAARKLRYAAFDEICRENGIVLIATAHNAGDNLETMLFNLSRGAGAGGLAGIPPKRGNIVRPLLLCSKPDIIEYCRENETGFVFDSTNADSAYTRNFIRNELVPRIKRLNPEAERSAGKLSLSLRQDDEFISSLADEYTAVDSVELLSGLHPALLSRVIMKKHGSAAEKYGSGTAKLTFEHINQLTTAIHEQKNTSLDLPARLTARISGGRLAFIPTSRTEKSGTHYRYELSEGELFIPEAGLRIVLSKDEKYINTNINIYKLFIHKLLNFAKINGNIYVRNRENGDRIRFGADEHTRSMKKLFSDAAASRFRFKGEYADALAELYRSQTFRDSVPIICDGNGPIYIPDFPSREDIVAFSTDSGASYDTEGTMHLYIIAE